MADFLNLQKKKDENTNTIFGQKKYGKNTEEFALFLGKKKT